MKILRVITMKAFHRCSQWACTVFTWETFYIHMLNYQNCFQIDGLCYHEDPLNAIGAGCQCIPYVYPYSQRKLKNGIISCCFELFYCCHDIASIMSSCRQCKYCLVDILILPWWQHPWLRAPTKFPLHRKNNLLPKHPRSPFVEWIVARQISSGYCIA